MKTSNIFKEIEDATPTLQAYIAELEKERDDLADLIDHWMYVGKLALGGDDENN